LSTSRTFLVVEKRKLSSEHEFILFIAAWKKKKEGKTAAE
jgi:hypothetical protein